MEKALEFVNEVKAMAKERGLNCFVVTDGYSGTTNRGNEAVKAASNAHKQWCKENGYE
jgi:hypothetical protein